MSEQQQAAAGRVESAVPSVASAGVWGGATVPVLLLLAAHLPFAVLHYVGTWKLEHYQFFPLLSGCLRGCSIPGVIRQWNAGVGFHWH